MTSNGMKDVDKTAFKLAAWMTAIVGIVAWRSDFDSMAMALTGGFPLGVLSFWIVYTLSHRPKREQPAPTATKKFQPAKLQKKSENPGRVEPLPRKKAVFAANPEPPVPFTTAASVAAAEGYVPSAEEMLAGMSDDPTVPADGAFNFLNSANYLYQPSRGRERQTTTRGISVSQGHQHRPTTQAHPDQNEAPSTAAPFQTRR